MISLHGCQQQVMPTFGQNRIWHKKKTDLAKTASGQKIRIWPGRFRDRIWPNSIWPEFVFQSVDRIWPNHIWPELVFLMFGHVCVCVSRFWVCSTLCVVCVVLGVFNCVCGVCCVFKIFGGCLQDFWWGLQDVWWVSSRFLVGVFKIFGGCLSKPLDPPPCWTAPPPDHPKISHFFPSPAGNFILSSLSGGSFRGILVVFEAPGRSNVHVWALGLLRETPAALGPAGLLSTTRELQTRTFERPGASNTTKIPREDPPEREERMKISGGREKKSEIWASPTPSGPHHPTWPPPHKKKWPNAVWPNVVWPNSVK